MEKATTRLGDYLVQVGHTRAAGYEAEIKNAADGSLVESLTGYDDFNSLWEAILKTINK